MLSLKKRLIRKESGATAIEYALIAASIATAVVVILGLLGNTVESRYQAVLNMFS